MYGLRKNSDYNLPGGSNRKGSYTKRQRNLFLAVVAFIVCIWYFSRGSGDATDFVPASPSTPEAIKKNGEGMPTPTGMVVKFSPSLSFELLIPTFFQKRPLSNVFKAAAYTLLGNIKLDDEAFINEMISRNKVVVFAKSYCGYFLRKDF